MKVFISWSGEKSRSVAEGLREWIPSVIQEVTPWMSRVDIDAGARWTGEVQSQLSETKFGIICVTRSNTTAPWLLFETGALAKTAESTYVCPYLIAIEPAEVPQGPLTLFQAKRANEKETLELMLTMNKALKEKALGEEQLRKTFAKWWPDLEKVIAKTVQEEEGEKKKPDQLGMLSEILVNVRSMVRLITKQENERKFSRVAGMLASPVRQYRWKEMGADLKALMSDPKFQAWLLADMAREEKKGEGTGRDEDAQEGTGSET